MHDKSYPGFCDKYTAESAINASTVSLPILYKGDLADMPRPARGDGTGLEHQVGKIQIASGVRHGDSDPYRLHLSLGI